MPFEFIPLEIPGVMLIKLKSFGDARGCFRELYKRSDFSHWGIAEQFVQDNYSRSVKGVLRGLHYQKDPAAQGKLVSCISGRIYDVAVDIRKGSTCYGKWVGAELSGENNYMLYVPAGCAHGFQVMSDAAEVIYKCTNEYSAADDRGIIWDDPEIGVKWPLRDPLLSEKDQSHPLLSHADNTFEFKK